MSDLMINENQYNPDFTNGNTGPEIFLAKVSKVFMSDKDFPNLDVGKDYIVVHNNNNKFAAKDTSKLGAIYFNRESSFNNEGPAQPFDKNNFTYPIEGEVILIIRTLNQYFYLPYTTFQYPNFRSDLVQNLVTKEVEVKNPGSTNKQEDYKNSKDTPNSTGQTEENKNKYEVKDKIKFLKPKIGDTILQGRVGNTIRFSEFFLTSDDKASSPSIFIRNKQHKDLDNKPIGELVEEDINKDGSSIYITSEAVKIPFKETIEKTKVAFQDYPKEFNGNQIFLNSDRILLSAKASQFIIYGKGNTGILTDGNLSADVGKEIYYHSKEDQKYQSEKNITLHSKGSNQIFLNSDGSGKIFLGKDGAAGDDGKPVQHMVLAGELKKILEDLIDQINLQVFLTPCGPTSPGPTNKGDFSGIRSRLINFYSKRNFLAKD
jgi:hypothetical protein